MLPSDQTKQNLLRAARTVLRPLVRIALRNGLLYSDFTKEVREAFIEGAQALAVESGRAPSTMRIRLMTGLPSTDVARLSQERTTEGGAADDQVRMDLHTVAASVMSAWHSESGYVFAYGLPVDLPIRASKGRPSLQHLVEITDDSVDVEVVVEQLLDAGCIKTVGDGRYTVVSRVYMPSEISAEGVRYFSEAIERFVSTVEHNLLGERGTEEKRMERLVFADHGIPESRLNELSEFMKKQWDLFANPIDDLMNSSQMSRTDPNEPIVNTGVGVYQYVSRMPAETSSEQEPGEGPSR
jgi:hypothetical protein